MIQNKELRKSMTDILKNFLLELKKNKKPFNSVVSYFKYYKKPQNLTVFFLLKKSQTQNIEDISYNASQIFGKIFVITWL